MADVSLKQSFWRLRENFLFWASRKINYPLIAPDMLQLCFLFRCNLRCRMCRMHERYVLLKQQNKCYELSLEVIKYLIRQASRMKIRNLYLVGGEPFLREDIFEIIDFADRHRMNTTITTNGTLLDTEMIDKILASKLAFLNVSLDGSSEEVYGRIRGEGILDKIKEDVRRLTRIKKERGLSFPKVSFLCTIMNQNIGELIDIVHLTKELGGDGVYFQPVVVDNTDQRLSDTSDPNWVPEEKYRLLDSSIDRLIDFKLSSKENFDFLGSSLDQLRLTKRYFRKDKGLYFKRRCYQGFSRVIITQDARMYFCVEGPVPGETSFGDVRKDKLADLWRSSEAKRFRVNMKRCQNPCLLFCSYRTEFDDAMKGIHKRLIKK